MSAFLNFAFLFLFALSIVFIFFNWKWALIAFVLTCIFAALANSTPENQAAIAKQEEKANPEIGKLKVSFQNLSENPDSDEILNHVLDLLESVRKGKLESLIHNIILPLLRLKPLDKRVRATVFVCAQKAISRPVSSNPPPSQFFYDTALEILQDNPEEIALKQYALEVGRWHYSIIRPDGKVTIYDEQSIQNDILVRTK